MGDKSRKKRPGRDSAQRDVPPKSPWIHIDCRCGEFRAWVSRDTGEMYALGDFWHLGRRERDEITVLVIEALRAGGFVPHDPLDVRDFLYHRSVAVE